MTPERSRARPVSAAEAAVLLADLKESPGLLLAVSGGPDSTALLVLAARWRARLKRGPKLTAVTVDHGLRPESRREAAAVKRLAARLDVPHRSVRWTGTKPRTGLQAAARAARYRLLAAQARGVGAIHIVTAHTLDDQAETVLLRLARGSGIGGLAGMTRVSPLPASGGSGLLLVRPFLAVPKARLIATLRKAAIDFIEDPSNGDPRFTRARLRQVMPVLAREGLDVDRLARLAARARRAEEAIEWAVGALGRRVPPAGRPVVFAAEEFRRLPAEIALRLLKKAIELTGDEGPVQLGKLETLLDGLHSAASSRTAALFRRTLAGASITLSGDQLTIEQAPPRRRLAALM
jgi:tRNA(Ile)-lysidine synthase